LKINQMDLMMKLVQGQDLTLDQAKQLVIECTVPE